jgi:hypothetical protein
MPPQDSVCHLERGGGRSRRLHRNGGKHLSTHLQVSIRQIYLRQQYIQKNMMLSFFQRYTLSDLIVVIQQ